MFGCVHRKEKDSWQQFNDVRVLRTIGKWDAEFISFPYPQVLEGVSAAVRETEKDFIPVSLHPALDEFSQNSRCRHWFHDPPFQ
jgi:hypothetical protein